MKVQVLFRNADSKLTCMMAGIFKSVKDAKAAIEHDALFFLDAHSRLAKNTARSAKAYAKWINPKTEDYFEVRGRDGASCVYQYFISK